MPIRGESIFTLIASHVKRNGSVALARSSYAARFVCFGGDAAPLPRTPSTLFSVAGRPCVVNLCRRATVERRMTTFWLGEGLDVFEQRATRFAARGITLVVPARALAADDCQ